MVYNIYKHIMYTYTYFKELVSTMWGLSEFLGQARRLTALGQSVMLPSRGTVSSSSEKPQFCS